MMRFGAKPLLIAALIFAVALSMLPVGSADATGNNATERATAQAAGSLLANNLMVTWYGNPHTGLMGVLGQFSGADLAGRLQRQADAYAPYTDKNILPAYELIAVVAMDSPGDDGLYRRQEYPEIIDEMLAEARAYGFHLVLDVQVGHSTVADELEYLRPWLQEPDVHLALDPEFDMWSGQLPGQEIGHTVSGDVNYAINYLDGIINEFGLPPKVLIVHQFTENMVPDKWNIGSSPVVDLVLDMDGFGSQWLKLDTWDMIMQQPLEFSGIKLFYDQDPGMFTPEEVMALEPTPSVVIYQ
ncbi:MAG: hypothetical protein ACOX87_01420 [Chloroflexota bacterium]|jgi:hypothetical protein